jgi:hypothetical protein
MQPFPLNFLLGQHTGNLLYCVYGNFYSLFYADHNPCMRATQPKIRDHCKPLLGSEHQHKG